MQKSIHYYTIPSDNRELQRLIEPTLAPYNYTIPSDNRELQLAGGRDLSDRDYTIPSDNRELQLQLAYLRLIKIIPYQVITGNYNTTVPEF